MVSCKIMRLVWIWALPDWVTLGKLLHLYNGGYNTSSMNDRHRENFNIIKEKITSIS